MPNESEQLAVAGSSPLASSQLAAFLGIEKNMMIETFKSQCFKSLKPGEEVTDAQLATFISIANVLRLNPLVPGMMYAYPDRQGGGITPIIGPDGVFKLLSSHKDIDSWEIETFPENQAMPPTHATCKIYRKGVERPVIYTAVYSEWKVASNPNWVTRPRHMLGIRALKQAARQLIHGLPFDEDERKIAEMVNVTDTAQPTPDRPAAPEKAPTGVAAALKKGKAKKSDAIEVEATPSAESAKNPEPPRGLEPSPTPALIGLADKEVVTVTCTVKTLKCDIVKMAGVDHKAVIAELEGAFVGKVYDLNGAIDHAGPKGLTLIEKSPWGTGVERLVTLRGQARRDPSAPCFVLVDRIEMPVTEPANQETPAPATGESLE